MPAGDQETPATAGPQLFATTHWSVVTAASDESSPAAQEALEKLCRTYWYPLYAFVRRQGHLPEDAEDLTQAFFAKLIGKHFIRRAQRERGRFRTFLLTSLKNFLVNEWKHGQAAKRGGEHPHLSWDSALAESLYEVESATASTPETIFERRYAATLFQQALARLETECKVAGKGAEFEQLKKFLSEEVEAGGYASTAAARGISTSGVAMAVSRLRQRYAELVREEIAHTVSSPGEIQDELRYLIGLLSA
jgi:RNA polymerase sigma-70 factor (ECF subfamily)